MVKRYALIFSVLFIPSQVSPMTSLSSFWCHCVQAATPVLVHAQKSFGSQSLAARLSQLADSRLAGYCALTALTCVTIVGGYTLAKKVFCSATYARTKLAPGISQSGCQKQAVLPDAKPGTIEPAAKPVPVFPVTQHSRPIILYDTPQAASMQQTLPEQEPLLSPDHPQPQVAKDMSVTEQPAAAIAAATEPTEQTEAGEQLPRIRLFEDETNHVWQKIQFVNELGQGQAKIRALVTVQQMKVNRQEKPNGGGRGSCGYHAGILNNPVIAAVAQGLIDYHKAKYYLRNADNEIIKSFAPRERGMASARAFVHNLRIKRILKNNYLFWLGACAPEGGNAAQDNVIISVYKVLCNEFLDSVIAEIVDGTTKTKSFARNEIMDALSEMPVQVTREQLALFDNMSLEQFAELIHKRETMSKYLTMAGTTLEISQDHIPKAWHEYNVNASSMGYSTIPEDGELLNGEEIDALIMHKRKTPIHERKTPESLINRAYNTNDVAVCTIESATKRILRKNETVTILKEALSQGRMPPYKYYAFHLGTMRQPKPQEGGQLEPVSTGHFVGVFLEIALNEHRWTITNSAHNAVLLFGKTSPADLIRYIEGKASHEALVPTAEFLACNVKRLNAWLERAQDSHIPRARKAHIARRLDRAIQTFERFSEDYTPFGSKERLDSRVVNLQLSLAQR